MATSADCGIRYQINESIDASLHERYKYLTPILATIFLDLIGNTFVERKTLFTLCRGQATLRLWWPRRRRGGVGGGGDRSTTNHRIGMKRRVMPNRPLEEQRCLVARKRRIPFSYTAAILGLRPLKDPLTTMRAQRTQLAGPRKRATSPFLSIASSTLFRLLYFPRSHRTLRVKRS